MNPSQKAKSKTEVTLVGVRIAFTQSLFEATPFKDSAPAHSATFLVPKGSELEKKVEKAVQEAAAAKWAAKGPAVVNSIRNNANRFNVSDGDASTYDGFQGHMAVRAKSKSRPTIIDRDRTPLSASDGRPYAGCFVNAIVEFFAYDNAGKGISANLKGVQFVRDGEAFAGSRPADIDDFEDLGADAGDDDITG